jgi:tRNA(Ile)-lysidine synthetase-like protein
MKELARLPLAVVATDISVFNHNPKDLQTAWLGRPLLQTWRSEIEAYCNEHNLQPRQDHTNHQPIYMRNRVRLQLLPQIEAEYKPGFRKNLVRLASLMQADEQLLDSLTEQAFARLTKVKTYTISFDLTAWQSEAPALQTRLLREAYSLLNNSLEDLEAGHLELIQQAASNPAITNWTLNLPGAITVQLNKQTHQLNLINTERQIQAQALAQPQLPPKLDNLSLDQTQPHLTLANGWILQAQVRLRSEIGELQQQGSLELGFVAYLDYNKTDFKLLVRKRLPGEKFQPLGAPGRRKLQDIMLDAHIPAALRANWPLVATIEQIIWLPGGPIAEQFKVTTATEQVLELKLFPHQEER